MTSDYPEPVLPTCEIRDVLKGQRALVTGANSGIGKAVAIALGQAGADVAVNFNSRPEQAEAVVQEIKGCGHEAFAYQADVSKEEQVEAMFRRTIDEFGTIDILVNNAGLQKDAPFDEMTFADWQLVLNVNLTASSSAPAKPCASSSAAACGECRRRRERSSR